MTDVERARHQYWRRNLTWLIGLLSIWFISSLGCGVLFVDFLDQFQIPGTGFKLGFWFAQQGSIVIFLALVVVYAAVMNRLDKQLGEEISRAKEGGSL